MTIQLKPEQEQAIQAAIQAGAFRSVDEFLDRAIAELSKAATSADLSPPRRKSRLWELREGLRLGDVSIKNLVEDGRG